MTAEQTKAALRASTEAQARVKRENAARDTLDMEWINSLPQPFMSRGWGASSWWLPVHDFEVATGLLRVDVCGLLEAKHISDIARFKDGLGREYHSEAFYSDAIPAEREPITETNK